MISGISGIAGGADSTFVLQRGNRAKNTATLICTARDVEGRELFLKFSQYTFVWELLSPIAFDVLIIPDEIFLLSDFIKSQGSFTETATELAKVFHLELRPAVLKKGIIKHMEHLNKNGISYSKNRIFERRKFSLIYNSNDDMTVESCSPNLPSLPSAPSVDSCKLATPNLPVNPHVESRAG